MRVPKIENYSNDQLYETIKLGKVPKVERGVSLASDREKQKIIKQVERIVRGSLEYRQYIDYLKRNVDMNACSYYKGVNRNEGKKVSIEIHHEPFYLFDISQIVLEKHIDDDRDNVDPLRVAEEVMMLHYQNKIGLIPISKTIHELVHKDKIFIPLQSVYGKYLDFLEEYEDYIPNDITSMLETKLRLSQDVDANNKSILEKKYVYLEVDGMTFPEVVEQ